MAESLKITIEVDGGQLKVFDAAGKSLADLSVAARGAGEAVERTGESARGAGSGFADFAKQAAATATGFIAAQAAGAAFAATMGSIRTAIGLAFEGIERGGILDDLAKKTGIAASGLSSMSLVLQATSVDFDTYARSLSFMSKQIDALRSGSDQAEASFGRFGLTARDFDGKGTAESFSLISARLQEFKDGTAKTAGQMELLGRNASALAPLLKEPAGSIAELTELASRLGLTITDEMAAALDSAGDKLGILGEVGTGVGQQLAVGLAGSIDRVAGELIDLVAEFDVGEGTIRDFGAAVGRVIEAVVGDFGSLEEIGGKVSDALDRATEIVNEFADRINSVGLGQALADALRASIPVLREAAVAIGTTIGEALVGVSAEAVKRGFASVDLQTAIEAGVGSVVGLAVARAFRADAVTGAAVGGGIGGFITDAFRSAPAISGATTAGLLLGQTLAGGMLDSIGKRVSAGLTTAFGIAGGPIGVALGTAIGAVAGPIIANLILDDLDRIDTAVRATFDKLVSARFDGTPLVQGAEDAIAAVDAALRSSADSIDRGIVRQLEQAGRTLDAEITAIQSKLSKLVVDPEFATDQEFRQEVEKLAQELNRLQATSGQVDDALERLGESGKEIGVGLGQSGSAAEVAGSKLRDVGLAANDTTSALQSQLTALQDQVSVTEEYIRVFDEQIEAGASFAEATEAAEEASERLALQLELGSSAATGYGQAILAAHDRLRELHEEQERRVALEAFNEETASLQTQIGLYQQVLAGTLSRAEAEREIAVQQKISEGLTRDQAEEAVGLAEQLGLVKEQVDGIGKSFLGLGTIGDSLKDSFSEVFDAIVAGTLDLGDAFKNMGIALGKNLFEQVLDEKLNFDAVFEGNITQLGQSIITKLGGAFGSVFGDAGTGIGGLFSGAAFSSGAFGDITDPTSLAFGAAKFGISEVDLTPKTITQLKNLGFGAGKDTGSFDFAGAINGENQTVNAIATGVAVTAGPLIYRSIVKGASEAELGIISAFNGIAGSFGPIGAIGGLIGTALGAWIGSAFRGGPSEAEQQRGETRTQFWETPTGRLIEERLGVQGFPNDDIASATYKDRPAAGSRRNIIDLSQGFGALFGANADSKAGDVFEQLRVGGQTGNRLAGLLNLPSLSSIFEDDPAQLEAAGRVAAGFAAELEGGAISIRNFGELIGQLNTKIDDTIAQRGAAILQTQFGPGLDTPEGRARVLGQAAYAGQQIFNQELPRGIDFGSLLLQSIGASGGQNQIDTLFRRMGGLGLKEIRDTDSPGIQSIFDDIGLNDVIENLPQEIREKLKDIAIDPEAFQNLAGSLLSDADFEVFQDTLDRLVKAATESGELIGGSLGSALQADSVTAGIDLMMATLGRDLVTQFDQIQLGNLLDTTAIAESFTPVFLLLDKFKADVAAGVGSFDDPAFGRLMAEALAAGRENLEFYAPQIRAAQQAMEEFRLIVEEALKPDPIVAFFQELQVRVDAFEAGFKSAFASAVEAGLAAGDKVFEETGDANAASMAAGDAFAENLGDSIRQSVRDAIVTGMVEAATTKGAIAPLLAQLEVLTAEAMTDGSISGAERANLISLGNKIIFEGERAIHELGPLFHQIFSIDLDAGVLSDFERQVQQIAADNNLFPADVESFLKAAEGVDPEALAEFFRLLEEANEPLRGAAQSFREVDASIDEDTLIAFFRAAEGVDPEKLTAYLGAVAESEEQLRAMSVWVGNITGIPQDTLFGFFKAAEGVDPAALEAYFEALQARDAAEAQAAERRATSLADMQDHAIDAGDALGGVETYASAAAEALAALTFTTNSLGGVPGAATGGSFGAGGAAVVGEAGMPELVMALPGGGFRVVPLDHAQAAALMGAGVAGFAAGGVIGGGAGGLVTRRGRGRIGGGGDEDGGGGFYGLVGEDFEFSDLTQDLAGAIQEAFSLGGEFAEDFVDSFTASARDKLAQSVLDGFSESKGSQKLLAEMDKIFEAAKKLTSQGLNTPEQMARFAEQIEAKTRAMAEEAKKLEPLLDALAVETALTISIEGSGLESVIDEFVRGAIGAEALNEAIYGHFRDGAVRGIIEAMLLEGPLADEIEKLTDGFNKRLKAAMKDGVLDEDEAEKLDRFAEKSGARIGGLIEAGSAGLKTLFGAIVDPLDEMTARFASGLEGAVAGAFRDGLTFEEFAQNAKQSIYENVLDGMTQAFLESAVFGTLLAPAMSLFDEAFKGIADGTLDIVAAQELILKGFGLVTDLFDNEEFKQLFDTWQKGFEDLRREMGITTDQAVTGSQSIVDASREITDQAEGVCTAKCDLVKRTTDLGEIITSAEGDRGFISLEDYVPGKSSQDYAQDEFDAWLEARGVGGISGRSRASYRRQFKLEFPEYRDIPILDAGGIVTGPTLAMLALNNRPEAVIPLDRAGGGTEKLERRIADLEAEQRRTNALLERLVANAERGGEVVGRLELDGQQAGTLVREGNRSNKRARRR